VTEQVTQRRPLVIAHRGTSAHEPEMTAAAYQRAIGDGADGLECDVRLSHDGVLVLIHDATVNRTTSGRGSVRSMTYAELAPLGLITLDDLIDLAESVSPGLSLSIETKHPGADSMRLEQAVYQRLRARRRLDPQHNRVMSFSLSALRRMSALDAQLPLVYLFDRPPQRHADGQLPAGITIAGISLAGLRSMPDYVARVHEHGNEVHVWTVNTEADLQWCVDHDVDGLITNHPGRARRMLGAATP